MIKTGIFSGSFNPIHIGHLALANWLCEMGELDEVWFLVTPQSPLKKKADLLDDHFRLHLVEKAIGSYTKFKACDIEFSLPRPLYTINTLAALTKQYPEHQFQLIIGADNWHIIDRWKDSEKLLTTYPVLVYPRMNYPITIPAAYPLVKNADAPLIEISSTFIREGIRQNKDLRFFLPQAIFEDIQTIKNSLNR
ncbi:nicotinate (nicotinamide) nucleotide adenylyltransferase [Massilibacteroides vaginae]|uniref:nicotinate (nicotinamide) nucleotide adenylyltransferase n=1 Tax=Massilibacteroides vaginae TaxID=1673718 RepID=UPI000A1CBBC4|nr:nicotinate (nicotinamide) nucleotide adenylyltransferase [Massilibacteroides vaginae]